MIESFPKNSPERAKKTVLDIAEKFCAYQETPEKTQLKKEIVEAIKNGEDFGSQLDQLENIDQDPSPLAQVGSLLQRASLFKEAGSQEAYRDILRDASDYAYQTGFDKLSDEIDKLL